MEVGVECHQDNEAQDITCVPGTDENRSVYQLEDAESDDKPPKPKGYRGRVAQFFRADFPDRPVAADQSVDYICQRPQKRNAWILACRASLSSHEDTFRTAVPAPLRSGASPCPRADADHSRLLFRSPLPRSPACGRRQDEGIWLSALCAIFAANEKSIGLKVFILGQFVQCSGTIVAKGYQNITVRNDY